MCALMLDYNVVHNEQGFTGSSLPEMTWKSIKIFTLFYDNLQRHNSRQSSLLNTIMATTMSSRSIGLWPWTVVWRLYAWNKFTAWTQSHTVKRRRAGSDISVIALSSLGRWLFLCHSYHSRHSCSCSEVRYQQMQRFCDSNNGFLIAAASDGVTRR